MINVHFKDVGRNNLTWIERMPDHFNELDLVAAVRRRKALISREIGFEAVPEGVWGAIYAGLREVGQFRIEANS